MKSFSEQIETLLSLGYRRPAARAKVAHDAILLAIAKSGLKTSSTIKGGVVMSHVTADVRRTTMDMDIAFIKRSLSDESIRRFVKKLNCISRVRISIFGTIGELLHEDYRGKRAYLDVTDGTIEQPIRTKLDIGVHTHSEIKQVEYDFHLTDEDEHADLLANATEQIFVEKLLSLLRHRALSKRPKDVFDLAYLCGKMKLSVLRKCIRILVYENRKCQVQTKAEMLDILKDVFASKAFMRRLGSVTANWLEISPEMATSTIVKFLESV